MYNDYCKEIRKSKHPEAENIIKHYKEKDLETVRVILKKIAMARSLGIDNPNPIEAVKEATKGRMASDVVEQKLLNILSEVIS